MRYVKCLALALVLYGNAYTQVKRNYAINYNGWYMFFGSFKFHEKLGLHTELQWRRSNLIADNQQLLLRGGLNINFTKQVFGTLGYAFVETYPYGEFASKISFPEHRIWEQLQFTSKFNKFEMQSRFRMEQRYVYSPVLKDTVYVVGKDSYTNRFRLLTRFSFPLNGEIIQDKTFYISIYEEFFINFGKNVGYNVFDQNRLYFAFGYKIPKLGKLEIGYLNQLVFKANGIETENNHTVQISLSTALDLFKKDDQLDKSK